MSKLVAQFNSVCSWCGYDIEPDQDIAPVDDVWLHGECADEQYDLRD